MLQARRQFWVKGFSNVSVRQIAGAAGVDIALISRHFGSKLGLFEASVESAFLIFEAPPTSAGDLVDKFVRIFAEAPRDQAEPSPILMLLTNAHDEEVGELVRGLYNEQVQQNLIAVLGQERAALFAAAVFGFSVAEKSLRVAGIASSTSQEYKDQFRHQLKAAIGYPSRQGSRQH